MRQRECLSFLAIAAVAFVTPAAQAVGKYQRLIKE